MSKIRISKMKIFWLRILGKKCCISCKHFLLIDGVPYCSNKERNGFEIRRLYHLDWTMNKTFLSRKGREFVGSACSTWE